MWPIRPYIQALWRGLPRSVLGWHLVHDLRRLLGVCQLQELLGLVEQLGAGDALRGVGREGLLQDLLDLLNNLRLGVRVFLFVGLHRRRDLRLFAVGVLAEEEVVQENPHAPHIVGGEAFGVSSRPFRGSEVLLVVRGRVRSELLVYLTSILQLDEGCVAYQAFAMDEGVLQVDVRVHQVLVVHVLHAPYQLPEVGGRPPLREVLKLTLEHALTEEVRKHVLLAETVTSIEYALLLLHH
mmetsp:Transcript_1054/g.2854  ORF Transcript_1054/g.2854 Transcript_1054/m.2854 type:complete len:239 (-) Transcript_1054:323-1039(-)